MREGKPMNDVTYDDVLKAQLRELEDGMAKRARDDVRDVEWMDMRKAEMADCRDHRRLVEKEIRWQNMRHIGLMLFNILMWAGFLTYIAAIVGR
jgi:hypothetical protein